MSYSFKDPLISPSHQASPSISDFGGGPSWELIVFLILAWVVTYLCVFQGVKSTGKVKRSPFGVTPILSILLNFHLQTYFHISTFPDFC